MTPADRKDFWKALAAVYALYRVELTDAVIAIWWRALQAYEVSAVVDALGRHAMNPDTGQFLPKPADVVRVLEGSTQDVALLAWAKVLAAVRRHGTYDSVVFDDPIVHRVITDLGGWVAFGTVTDKELPFVEKRFRDAYRAWRTRDDIDFPPRLPGRIEAQNSAAGFPGVNVTTHFIGDRAKAEAVLAGPKPMLRLPEREAATG